MATTHPPQPLPDVPNAIMIKISGTISGQPWVNILHCVHDAATANSTDLTTMAQNILNAVGTQLKPIWATTCSCNLVVCTDISSRTGSIGATALPVQTGVVGGGVANNVSYAVGWTIGRRYRGGHPRTYHTGLCSTQLNGQTQVQSTFRTTLLSAWAGIKTAIETTGLATIPNPRMCAISYFHGKNTDGSPALRGTPIVDVITGVKGDLRIDSQRHRLGRPV